MSVLAYRAAIPSTEAHTMTTRQLIQEWDKLPLVLTPAQVANILQLDGRTVVNMCARGEIHAAKIAGNWRISRDEVMRLIAVDPARRTP